MISTSVVNQHKVISFIGGTILIQAFVLAAAFYLSSRNAVEYSSSSRITAVKSEKITEPVKPVIPTTESIEQNIVEKPIAEELPAEQLIAEPAHETVTTVPDAVEPEVIPYTVKLGDTLTGIWTTNGGTYGGGLKAAAAFKKAKVSLNSIRSGSVLEFQHNEAGDIISFRMKLEAGKFLELSGDSESGYKAEIIKSEIVEQEKRVSAVIESSISATAAKVSLPYQVVDELVDLFSSRISFRRDLHRGDSFSIIMVEHKTPEGELLNSGYIKAASIKIGNEMYAAVRHTDEKGKARYYDEQGVPIGSYFLRYPLRFTRIASVFNKSRFHPILKRRRPHHGVDFAAPTGTPVRTVADGVVVKAGYYGGAGRMIRVRHSDTYTTEYMHLSKISGGIRKGAKVKRGQLIGNVGKTGLATGPHLHFSLYKNSRYVDPLKVKLPRLPVGKAKIPDHYLQTTLEYLEEQHRDIVQVAWRAPEVIDTAVAG